MRDPLDVDRSMLEYFTVQSRKAFSAGACCSLFQSSPKLKLVTGVLPLNASNGRLPLAATTIRMTNIDDVFIRHYLKPALAVEFTDNAIFSICLGLTLIIRCCR